MKDFSTMTRAAALPRPARVLYTIFAGFTFAGLLSSVALYDRIVAFSAHATPQDLYARLVEHYTSATALPALLDTTHAHLFTLPVLLLVVGHLYFLTGASANTKITVIAIATAATLVHLLAPWIIYATNGAFASGVLYPLSGGALLLSYSGMLAAAVWEMWRKPAISA